MKLTRSAIWQIVIALLILTAIALPSLLRSRIAAREPASDPPSSSAPTVSPRD